MVRPLALVLGMTLAGCDGAEGDTDDTGDDQVDTSELPDTPTPPLVRAVHLAPGLAPPCDLDGDTGTTADAYYACLTLFVGDGQTPIDDNAFPFGASSGFLPLPITGTYDFQAVPWATWVADPYGANNADDRVASFPMTVLPETVQTFVAYGHPGYANTGLKIIADDALLPPTAGQARLRLFHGMFAASVAAPDIALGATPLTADLPYAGFSAWTEVAPGDDQTLLVDMNGDADPDLVALLDLAADTTYDLFLVNVSTSVVPSGVLGFLHTPTSQVPVLAPFGPI